MINENVSRVRRRKTELENLRSKVIRRRKKELDSLRSNVTRILKKVKTRRLAADVRFSMAYDAARTLSQIRFRAADCYQRSPGMYDLTAFIALREANTAFAPMARSLAEFGHHFDRCYLAGDGIEFDFSGGPTGKEADQFLKTVQQFEIDVKAWMKSHHAK